ncbi:FKBP-type peptidyl-prolyl cis-trans isomerase [Actinotalea sp.]|uniref:FKBP-type peptidyl-prolyl cis-trans isomerase n=1 Tax=Actinotalea sp. TaxID=1872145 RepID=UPI002B665708|nr:FKBP-type peptidyl-prolyl cis-trans isomerase [Actinotalea sp.]HQY32817.1 FKBP-type peptidyl-prolyl cis-trans isomerase [Actinotalea sp.]HRA51583.1 FKBP-type peptidyl-prolyl cis-trans isomerase [Actinotalea sp.]
MRRPATAATAALALLATLALAGCSSSDGAEATPSASTSATDGASTEASPEDVAALAAVTAEGDLGAAPTLTFDQPFTITGPVARPDVEGTGDTVEAGSLISFHYVAVSGDDGSVLLSTWDENTPQTLSLADGQIFPELTDAILGQQVGARVLFAVPGTAAVEATDTTAAVEATPATLMALEILGISPTRAEGDAVAPVDGLPLVTLAENGEPSIEIPAGTVEPTELVVQPLITGAGAVVEAGQLLTVQYSGWTFDGTQFDSSWVNGAPFQTLIGSGAVIDGWDQGIVGQTVGSQVLLVIPSALAYGGTESELADSTLIFVVDILSAD